MSSGIPGLLKFDIVWQVKSEFLQLLVLLLLVGPVHATDLRVANLHVIAPRETSGTVRAVRPATARSPGPI